MADLNGAVKLTKDQLITHLKDMLASVEADDSFEGNIAYSALDERCERNEFMVRGVFRVGNSMGQGGCVLIAGDVMDAPV